MNIYTLRPDSDRYQDLVLENEDDAQLLTQGFAGEPMRSRWRTVVVEVCREEETDRDLPPSDYPSFYGVVPVFSERAIDVLRAFLEPNGELLPLTCAEGTYQAYNCTRVLDAIDEDRSRLTRHKGLIMRIDQPEFFPERVAGLEIFKWTGRPTGPVFVGDGFVKRVREAGLVGFKLERVWSGTDAVAGAGAA
jgi:hypothetical protein